MLILSERRYYQTILLKSMSMKKPEAMKLPKKMDLLDLLGLSMELALSYAYGYSSSFKVCLISIWARYPKREPFANCSAACNVSLLTTAQSAIADDLNAFSETSWFSSAYMVSICLLLIPGEEAYTSLRLGFRPLLRSVAECRKSSHQTFI